MHADLRMLPHESALLAISCEHVSLGSFKNQARRYRDRMVLGVSADGMPSAAFLPKGGTIRVDLTALAGTTVGVTWYNLLTGRYHDQGTTSGGAVRSFASPFGANQSALVLMAH
jgi:Putative collagen-binding domain of a collagenase